MTAVQAWIAEATEVLDLVGDHPNTDSMEDCEFRDKAPAVLHAALDALEKVLTLATSERDRIRGTYSEPPQSYAGYADAMDDVIATIESVLAGADS